MPVAVVDMLIQKDAHIHTQPNLAKHTGTLKYTTKLTEKHRLTHEYKITLEME